MYNLGNQICKYDMLAQYPTVLGCLHGLCLDMGDLQGQGGCSHAGSG